MTEQERLEHFQEEFNALVAKYGVTIQSKVVVISATDPPGTDAQRSAIGQLVLLPNWQAQVNNDSADSSV